MVSVHTVRPSRSFRPKSLSSKPSSDFCKKNGSEKGSFLWEIAQNTSNIHKSGQPQQVNSYFFGTIHVPYSKVWDEISEATKKAFEDADHVVFELDLTDHHTVQTLSKCQMLPDGINLSAIIPGDLYKRLENHLDYVAKMMPIWMSSDQRGRKIYPRYLYNVMTNNWQNKRPVWVMLMLNSLTESDIKSRGAPVLDLYLAQEAARMGKQIGAVERVEEQCLPLNSMNLSQVVYALDQSLLQHEIIRKERTKESPTSSTEDLIKHYICGDLDSVIYGRDSSQIASSAWSVQDEQGKAIDEYFRTELLQKRNRRMAKRVIELLKTYPKRKYFFAFGAGHFLGNHSVIAYMEEMGYAISHLSSNHQIKSTASGRRKNRISLLSASPRTSSQSQREELSSRGGELGRESERLIANPRSDYVDARAYERQRKRKPQANEDGELSSRRKIASAGYSRFNDLWMTAESTTAPPNSMLDGNYFRISKQRPSQNSGAKLFRWSPIAIVLLYSMFSLLVFY